MRKFFCLTFIICLLLCGCYQTRTEISAPDLPADSAPARAPESQAESSSRQPESSRGGYVVPSAPMIPDSAPDRNEKAPASRDNRLPQGSQPPALTGVDIVESDLDPENNTLIITLKDADGILAANLKYIEGLPERYGVQNEGIHQIDGGDYYYYFRFFDNTDEAHPATIGYYYVNGRTGQLFKHEYIDGVDRLRLLTD